MQREGVLDVDATILQLADIVPVLQIEALGHTAEDIVAEAKRQEALGLDRSRTVYKIPISLEGARACRMLREEGFLVNLHLVYTLQQAYIAMAAGATYVCPLVGRLQDQGTDALQLVSAIVDMKHRHGYETKIMFSSVRHLEHIRNAIEIGVDTITVPWKVMQQMTSNHLTQLGSDQFYLDNRRVTMTVAQAMRAADVCLPPHIDGSGSPRAHDQRGIWRGRTDRKWTPPGHVYRWRCSPLVANRRETRFAPAHRANHDPTAPYNHSSQCQVGRSRTAI